MYLWTPYFLLVAFNFSSHIPCKTPPLFRPLGHTPLHYSVRESYHTNAAAANSGEYYRQSKLKDVDKLDNPMVDRLSEWERKGVRALLYHSLRLIWRCLSSDFSWWAARALTARYYSVNLTTRILKQVDEVGYRYAGFGIIVLIWVTSIFGMMPGNLSMLDRDPFDTINLMRSKSILLILPIFVVDSVQNELLNGI